MSRTPLIAIAVSLACTLAAPLPVALGSRSKTVRTAQKGDLIVTFSGNGGGGYHFRQAATGGSGSSCRTGETTYTETDAYNWSYSFVLPPSGGSSDNPWQIFGGGLLSGSQQLAQCGGTAAATGVCTQSLRAPTASNIGDFAYPGVTVQTTGRVVTVGALGELIRPAVPPSCSGFASLLPNVVQGYTELQASVSFPRALLNRTGGYRSHFTMAGAGLYTGVTLSGSCNSTTCSTANCQEDALGGGGAPSACTFNESYIGTIEVRVVR